RLNPRSVWEVFPVPLRRAKTGSWRTWKRRAELTTEEDIGEFISRLLSGLATPQPTQVAQGGDGNENLPAPSDEVLQAAQTVEQHVMSNQTLAQEKQEET